MKIQMKIGEESTLLKISPPVLAERSSAHSLAPPIMAKKPRGKEVIMSDGTRVIMFNGNPVTEAIYASRVTAGVADPYQTAAEVAAASAAGRALARNRIVATMGGKGKKRLRVNKRRALTSSDSETSSEGGGAAYQRQPRAAAAVARAAISAEAEEEDDDEEVCQ